MLYRVAMSPRAASASPALFDTLPAGRSFQSLAKLKLLEGNPRLITTKQFGSLMNSIRRDPRFLLVRPIAVADGSEHRAGGIVYGGNMRVRALDRLYKDGWFPPNELKKLGWEIGYCPIDVDDIPEEQARERAIQDNNTWGTWNDQELAEMLYELDQAGSDLSVLGFDQRVLEDLMASVAAVPADEEQEEQLDEYGRPTDLPPQALTTEERLKIYENQSIRQVVLYFPKEEYEAVLELLDWLRGHFEAESNTEAVHRALLAYRETHDDGAGDDNDDE